MVFSSFTFLWIFLPIIFIGYYLIQSKFKNIFLLLGSLIFYAWGEPHYIMIMLYSIIINYFLGILIDRYDTHKKVLLIFDIVINLIVLGYFKYFNFAVEIINKCTGLELKSPNIALPIGISFFTFQILSYIIDLYRGQYRAQKNIINLALYIAFFPQLIAGPIVKYKDINEQLNHRVCTLEKVAEGIRRFIYGLGKKVIIANTVAYCVDSIYALDSTNITGLMAWLSAILYSLQIYFDFSGYSDMAIGLGKIFGFEFQENFNYPYLSSSIQEFWQRWHISLGTWFREYIYIPLGGNRNGKFRTYLNLIIVFLITGLWHGASFNFILWGGLYGLIQVIERMGFKKLLRNKIFAHLYTIIIFIFGWVIFRAENLTQAVDLLIRMLLPWRYTESSFLMSPVFGPKTIFIILSGILGCGIIQEISSKIGNAKILWKNSFVEIIYCSSIFILCLAMLAGDTYNPFIYFRF